jgi:hypothetical protein
LREIAFMIAIEVQHYLGCARDFLKGVDLLKDDLVAYKYSSALLGIHAAISYSDAIRIGLGSKRLSSDDHRSAVEDLRTQIGARNWNAHNGPDRLQKLLGYKSKIAYGQYESGLDFGGIIQDAVRFAAWAESAGKALRIEGWRDE